MMDASTSLVECGLPALNNLYCYNVVLMQRILICSLGCTEIMDVNCWQSAYLQFADCHRLQLHSMSIMSISRQSDSKLLRMKTIQPTFNHLLQKYIVTTNCGMQDTNSLKLPMTVCVLEQHPDCHRFQLKLNNRTKDVLYFLVTLSL